jgi:transcriptional regulator with XRE-family HTH domain
MTVPKKIESLIKKSGLSQGDFAVKIGAADTVVNGSSIVSQWKSEKTTSYKKYLPKIAELCNVSLDWLSSDDDSDGSGKNFWPEVTALNSVKRLFSENITFDEDRQITEYIDSLIARRDSLKSSAMLRGARISEAEDKQIADFIGYLLSVRKDSE